MIFLWMLCALISLISISVFLKSGSHKGFLGIVFSIIMAISMQIGLTVKSDKVVALASNGADHFLYKITNKFEKHICTTSKYSIDCALENKSIKITKNDNLVSINGKFLSKDKVYYEKRSNFFLINIKNNWVWQTTIAILTFSILGFLVWRSGSLNKNREIYHIILNARNFWIKLSFLEKLVLTFFPLIFCLSTTGVDIDGLNHYLQLNSSGHDIYFIQAILRHGYWQNEFAGFPYPIFAAAFFTPYAALFTPIANLLGDNLFGLDPIFTSPEFLPLKLNIYFTYLSAAVIFASNIHINGIKQNKLFYAFFFFPISFYISGLYGHLDAASLLIFVLFIILLPKSKEISIKLILIQLLLAVKLQTILILFVLISPCLLYLNKKLHSSKYSSQELWFLGGGALSAFLIIYGLQFINPSVPITLFQYPQNARTWMTVLPYTQGVYFYYSIFALLCAHTAWVFLIEKCHSDTDILISTSIGTAIVILWFFSAILFTHTFLSLVAPAFALVISSSRITFIRKLLFIFLSCGAVSNLVFFSNGDISRIFFQKAIFSGQKSTQFISLTHTLAVSALLLLGFLFYDSFSKLKDSGKIPLPCPDQTTESGNLIK